MKIAAIDTGETNALVITDSGGHVIRAGTDKSIDGLMNTLQRYRNVDLVLLERAGSQPQYLMVQGRLASLGYNVMEISPGEWKPNPQCRVSKTDKRYTFWSQHERDALSLIKYYRILRRAKEGVKGQKERKVLSHEQ